MSGREGLYIEWQFATQVFSKVGGDEFVVDMLKECIHVVGC